jgi:hypothetical protein
MRQVGFGAWQSVAKVWRRTERGEAPRPARRDPGAPDARFPARCSQTFTTGCNSLSRPTLRLY